MVNLVKNGEILKIFNNYGYYVNSKKYMEKLRKLIKILKSL